MHKRLKLGDGYQRSSDDDTSSGCSSAGGGLRNGNIIITPPRDSSSSSSNKPYYGMDDQSHLQHQQPKNGMLSSRNNSFSPYSIRPLVVRAKRKRSEGTSVNVTSTAQRIIDTLNSFSTPVVNSSKVPFDSLKNFRPIVTPIRRDTHGPPIMKSPLVPTPEGKIYYNPAMNIHIPRLVEFGTNTDLTMSTFTYDQLEELNSNPSKGVGGGKMKLTSRVHSAPIKPNEPPSLPPQLINQIISSSMIEPSKFRFNTSWGPANVHKSLGSDEMYIVFTGKGTYVGQTSTSLCRKCRAHLKQPDVVSPTTMTTAMAIMNDTVDKSGANIPLKIAMPPPTQTWNCPTCLVPNKPEASNCVCCGEKNSKAKATTTITKSAPAKNWECPTCMVQNKPEASSCVCCSEKNPNSSKIANIPTSSSSSSFQFGFKPATTSDTTTSLSKPSTPLSTFTFGAPATTSSSTATTKSTFTFGVTNSTAATKTDTLSSTSSAFSFGTSSSSSKPETPNKTAMITATTTTIETPKSSFTFGTGSGNNSMNSSPSAAKPSPIPVSFGVPAEPSAATAVKSSTTFGLPTKAPEVSLSAKAATPPTIEKSLVSQSPPNNPFGSFAFGTTKTTSNLSGVIKDDSEFWQCDRCPARSRITSNHCVVCLGPKPTADTSSKSKPTSVKKFHFEPFFGGKVDDSSSENQSQNQITSSYQEEELKRKVPSSSSSASTTSGSGSSLGFMYTPPSEPALKLKTPEPAPPGGQPTTASEIKTGSFLDALKQGSQFTFSTPSPGSSIIPSGTTPLGGQQPSTTATVPASVMSMSPISTTSNSNAPATAVSSTTSSWGGGPPAGLFQFGAPANMNTTNTSAGANANAAMNMTGNNISSNNGSKTTMFTFGGMKNGPVVPTPSSTPSIFGSSLSTGVTTTPSVFGAPSIVAAPAVSNPAAAATSPFNLTPNINFMSPGAAGVPAPGSFVFNAQPSPGGGSARDMGQRKIRRATRRIRP